MTAVETRSITLVGAGTMGRGIAQVGAQTGFRVRLTDVDRAALDAAMVRIREGLSRAVERGKLDAAGRDAALASLAAEPDLAAAAAGADLVIEAVPERLDLKREILGKVAAAAPGALLASNTSSLSIADIAAGLPDPSRVVGMHFFVD